MNNGNDTHGVSRVVQHKDYYLRGGDLTVIVEKHLYRIHSYFFDRESLFFRQKFGDANKPAELGSTDGNAYTLEDVKSEDFSRLLWVFYNPRYSIYDAPLDTWLSILKLSNKWAFDSVKELSVRELEKITIEPIQKISIYQENNISRVYLIPSYIDVCKRDKPLSFSEGMGLGMETVLRIAEARERMRLQASESGVRSPTFEDFEDGEVEVLIRKIFQLGPRPTSPTTAPASNGVNGVNNTIKLQPAPTGNVHQKANGAPAPRANGGSVADPKRASDPMPSISSVIPPQDSADTLKTEASAMQATGTPTATLEQQAADKMQAASTPQAAPPPPPPTKDSKETDPPARPSSTAPPKPAGEPSPLVDFLADSASNVSHNPVVQSSERSDDLASQSKNIVNDGKKDELKDIDTASVAGSDTEGPKSAKPGARKARNRGAARGGKQ